jgi:hypothetical protein
MIPLFDKFYANILYFTQILFKLRKYLFLHNFAIALSFQQDADFIARRIDEMRCKKTK